MKNLALTKIAVLALASFGAVAAFAPGASAQTPPPVPSAGDCAQPAQGLPFTATAGTKLLSSGAGLFTHDGSNATIILHIPVSGAVDPAAAARALDAGDAVSSAPSADGNGIDVTWTLADPTSPLRRLAVSVPGLNSTIRALNLRGLLACVTRNDSHDVVDISLPNHLGTLHLRLSDDATQLIASTGDTDRLAISGSVALPSLAAQIDVKGRLDAGDTKRLTPLGSLAVVADGLALQSARIDRVIDVGGLRVSLQQFALRLSRGAPAVASVAFTPVLSSSLPFSIGTLTADVDGAGDRLAIRCTSPLTISFTSKDVAVGSGPFKDLHLAIDTTSPSQLTCDGTRYNGFETVFGLRWDNVLNTPLTFQLVASTTGVRVTPLNGASFPDLDVGSDALGLRFHLTAPQLSVDTTGSDDALRLDGRLAVEFAAASVTTTPLALSAALRTSNGSLSAALSCTDDVQKNSRIGPGGPFGLSLRLNCINREIAGVASDGGELDLPAKAGGIHVKIPAFTFAFADRSLSPADLKLSITSAGSGSALDFPGGRIDSLALSYDPGTGLRVVGTASVNLPTGQDAMQRLTIHDVAVGRRGSGLGIVGVGHIESPDFTFAGMAKLQTLTDNGACKDAKSPVDTEFTAATERVDVKLCASVALLPSFLTPKQTQSHVGDLGSGGGIIPPGDATVSLKFRGLVIGHDGIPVNDTPPVTECPADTKPSGLTPQELQLLKDEQQEYLDCRVEAQLDSTFALGPLELRQVNVNLIRALSDKQTTPSRPQFRVLALVKFGKYLSTDGGTSGVINAQFNNRRMVVAGHFADVVNVRFGVVSAGIRGFSMDFSDQQRSFVAEGGQISSAGSAGVSTTTLYFSEIAFVEVRGKNGEFKIAKLRAPVDVKRTGLGLLFRLVSDLGSMSFLHIFKLP
jgi:hypothetical protein